MKLEKILDNLNSLEKNSFIKTIDNIINNQPKNIKAINNLISDSEKSGLKNLDNVVISKIYSLVENEFLSHVRSEFLNTASQLDIIVDILIRDGNCLIKQDWLSRLYEKEIDKIKKKVSLLKKELNNPKGELPEIRKRDYNIYKACVIEAYQNDIKNNRDSKITDDELGLLITLSKALELSQEEVKLINYLVSPPELLDVDEVINNLKGLGLVFYSKKLNTVYVPDEIIRTLRKLRNKEVADKFYRRVLKQLKDSQINQVCRKHNIDRKLTIKEKIKVIISEGISFSEVLSNDIHKIDTTQTERKKLINELWDKGLGITPALKGTTIDEKISNLINYFELIEKDEKVSISIDGYEKLLIDLETTLSNLNTLTKTEFELQDENALQSALLLDYNIKPRDILEIINSDDLNKFCKNYEIKTRGNIIENILEAYKDSDNLYLENYVNVGFRNQNELKLNGINIKESELGLKFEELTKKIFSELGFNVDEGLKSELNTKKDKIDLLLNLGNRDLILIECKTVKESGYNKFSSVSRQMKSYTELAKKNDFKIIKSLLIAPDFSDDFINETELEYDLNLSLIKASSLYSILEGFRNTKKHKSFPYKLLMRDVLINEDRIIKAMKK